MDGNYKLYDYAASATRIKDILTQPTGQFKEVESLPDRDRLTYTNGFYAHCAALFVDIRDSSGLTSYYKRPALAKLYRSFISEMVAVLNADPFVREVNIVGDCAWAVYNAPTKPDIDDVFTRAYYANTLVRLLNVLLAKHGYERGLKAGIGLEYGRALMIKAGYSGSGLNEIVYMGEVVNTAAHLASKAGRGWSSSIWAGETFAQNLNQHNQSLLTSKYEYSIGQCRIGDVVATDMDNWIDNNYA